MKKRIVLFALLQLLMLSLCFSQQKFPDNVPDDIKKKCMKLKQTIKLKLDSCRINNNLGKWKATKLSSYILYDDGGLSFIDKEKEKELYPLQLDWKMLYDDEMIERMVQLLKNEYRKEELELLVNKQMAHYEQVRYERWSLYQIGLEYPEIFKHTQDSLDKYRNRETHPELYQYDDVGMYLKWDTLPRFHFLVDSFKVAVQEETVNYYLTKIHFNIKGLLSLCYYVPDQRFISPLIDIAEHLEQYGLAYNPHSIDHASEVLVKMQVEPYYSNYFKKVSYSLEEIKQMTFAKVINFLSFTFHNQDAYLELSKYLHSSAATRAYYSEDEKGGITETGKAYEDAFKEIEKNIENKDLREIINAPGFDLERDRFKVYDWMQKNYGKYQIRRIW